MGTVEIVIAVAVVAALAYFFLVKKKAGDVNNDGAVNVEDAKVVVEKVEEKVEAAVVEVKAAAKKTVAKAKTAAAKKPAAKKPAKGGAGGRGGSDTTALN
jgi:hypothetical protein